MLHCAEYRHWSVHQSDAHNPFSAVFHKQIAGHIISSLEMKRHASIASQSGIGLITKIEVISFRIHAFKLTVVIIRKCLYHPVISLFVEDSE